MDTICDLTFDGENSDDRFGRALALGKDVDGDGYGDMIIGSRYYLKGKGDGRACLYYSAQGTSMDNICDLTFYNQSPGENFATDVDLFDIDNDNLADIIIAARRYDNIRGRVYIYWGIDRINMDTTPDKYLTGEDDYALFGGDNVDCGYVNNDDYGDILVAGKLYPHGKLRGRMYLYFGNTKALMDTTCYMTFTGENDNDRFGYDVAIGDINGDDFSEVLTGARTFKSNSFQGRAYLYYGGPTEPQPTQEIKSLDKATVNVNIKKVKSIVPTERQQSPYLDAVRTFADNVLKYGRDTYGPKHTPLFVDGLNIHTHEPVKWISKDGERWILSNLASQQNLFRTLDGLTRITGDPKYKQAAMDAIKYAFDNLRSPNGLLYWGGVVAYDAHSDDVCGDWAPCSSKTCGIPTWLNRQSLQNGQSSSRHSRSSSEHTQPLKLTSGGSWVEFLFL